MSPEALQIYNSLIAQSNKLAAVILEERKDGAKLRMKKLTNRMAETQEKYEAEKAQFDALALSLKKKKLKDEKALFIADEIDKEKQTSRSTRKNKEFERKEETIS